MIVPVSFTVGLTVDFITRLSKLDKYGTKATSRSLERIFVTGTFGHFESMIPCLAKYTTLIE